MSFLMVFLTVEKDVRLFIGATRTSLLDGVSFFIEFVSVKVLAITVILVLS